MVNSKEVEDETAESYFDFIHNSLAYKDLKQEIEDRIKTYLKELCEDRKDEDVIKGYIKDKVNKVKIAELEWFLNRVQEKAKGE